MGYFLPPGQPQASAASVAWLLLYLCLFFVFRAIVSIRIDSLGFENIFGRRATEPTKAADQREGQGKALVSTAVATRVLSMYWTFHSSTIYDQHRSGK